MNFRAISITSLILITLSVGVYAFVNQTKTTNEFNSSNEVDSLNFLQNVKTHAERLRKAELNDDLDELYLILKENGDDLPPLNEFKAQSVLAFGDGKGNYDSGIIAVKDILPSKFSFKNGYLQCVVFRKITTKYTGKDREITTQLWYYSKNGVDLKFSNFAKSIDSNSLKRQFSFIDTKLFNL